MDASFYNHTVPCQRVSSTMATPSPQAIAHLLESFIPGFSIINELSSNILNIDITSSIWTLVALLGLAAGLTYFKNSVVAFYQAYLVSTVEIQYDDEAYHYLMLWLARQQISQRARHFIARTTVKHTIFSDSDSDSESSDDDDNLESADEAAADPSAPSSEATALQAAPLDDATKPLRYTPAYGTHYFRYQGRWLALSRMRDMKPSAPSPWQSLYTEQVYVSAFGRDPTVLKELLRDAQLAYAARDGGKTVIYRHAGPSDHPHWTRCLARPPRPMSTVVLDQEQKDTTLEDMREYLHPRTRRWYAYRGIPWRRGYLLHGPPGTGKTSFCFAAAGLLRLRVYVASLNSARLSEEGLAALFRDLPRKCIVLLEDVDAAGLSTKRSAEPPAEPEGGEAEKPAATAAEPASSSGSKDSGSTAKISLSGFLNIIDGVASSEGRILVLTTNHVERLDAALLRPGRIDRTVLFSYATPDVAAGLFRAIFATLEADGGGVVSAPLKSATPVDANGTLHGTLPVPRETKPPSTPARRDHRYHALSDGEVATLAQAFATQIPPDEFTPAELQGYLLQHKHDPEAALAGTLDWIEKRRAEKKVQKSGV